MGYILATKNSTYLIQDTMNPDRAVISGGKLNDCEIYKPTGIVGEGQPFVAVFTDNIVNGDLRGKTMRTSPIQSVHDLRATEGARQNTQRALDEKASQMRYESRVRLAERLYTQPEQFSQYEYQ